MSNLRGPLTSGLGQLRQHLPWIRHPLIVGAPMKVMAGPELALAVSKAGGLGFIGPGGKTEDTITDLAKARELLTKASPNESTDGFPSDGTLPIGAGFQLWDADLKVASSAIQDYRPCAAWLFAPEKGQEEIDEWVRCLRKASPPIQIWVQVGTLREAVESYSSTSPPDALVVQGAEAGGHGRAKDGLGIMSLLPEISDACSGGPRVSIIAAGGIADGRGVAAAIALGADGVAMGTRFLASTEARINKEYRNEVVRATDGAHSTTRTTIYNQLRGVTGWPPQYSPRGIINQTWHDYQAGVTVDRLKQLHDEAQQSASGGWGPEGRVATYAGAAVGLIHQVEDAGQLVENIRLQASQRIQNLGQGAD